MYTENPFDAEFGGIPELYLDFNEDAVKYAKKAHRLKKHPTYSLFITGVRGSGKTVFMNKVGKELSKYDDTVVITLHNTEDLKKLSRSRSLRVKRAADGIQCCFMPLLRLTNKSFFFPNVDLSLSNCCPFSRRHILV